MPNVTFKFLHDIYSVGKKTGQRKKQRNQSGNRCPFVKVRIQGRVCGGIQRVKLILQCFTLLVHKKEFAEHSVQLAALLLCGDLKQVKLTLESNKAFLKLVQGNNILRIDFLLWVFNMRGKQRSIRLEFNQRGALNKCETCKPRVLSQKRQDYRSVDGFGSDADETVICVACKVPQLSQRL